MNSTILLQISPDDLKSMLTGIVNECLHQQIKSEPPPEIIDRPELCKRLGIVEPTVIKWEKKGKIPSLRIGSSVRYNWQRVLQALEKKGGKP